jgi:site-specific DNA-methyltransferase (adenine-specific)
MSNKLHHGDCLEVMPTLDADSVDAIISDPPYGLSFMGKAWDHGVPGEVFWREALRVAKPGAHLLAFGGTRTFHRLTVAIEDAGWEIRDCVMWVYGSGFPKSHNGEWGGTALKPAWEPIIVARKPLIGTVAANVLAHGTGGINVDACRVGDTVETWPATRSYGGGTEYAFTHTKNGVVNSQKTGAVPSGRWPANLIHDGSDEVTDGMSESARFFYCAKASKADRDEGCEGMPQTIQQSVAHGNKRHGTLPYTNELQEIKPRPRSNNHPTVKPTALMRYLCKLVTPLNGIILDPFMGSGSTGKAATLERFNFIGIDLSAEYVAIAQARIDAATKQIAEQLQYGSS